MNATKSPRVLDLSELDAFCYDDARRNVEPRYTIERISRSRVTLSANDGKTRAEIVVPCYPHADGVRVVLDPLRVLLGDVRLFAPLLEGLP